MVNGKAYTPDGSDGNYPNFRVFVDPSDCSVDISAYSYKFNSLKADIIIGSKIVTGVSSYYFESIKPKSWVMLRRINNCYTPIYDTVFNKGVLIINKYDIANGIISGEFECDVYCPNCILYILQMVVSIKNYNHK